MLSSHLEAAAEAGLHSDTCLLLPVGTVDVRMLGNTPVSLPAFAALWLILITMKE